MKAKHFIAAILIAMSMSTNFAFAQTAASADDGMTMAEVRKVDKGAKKITLKHAEIKSMGMPPMTMVFRVKDEAMLEKVKAGDKVRFQAEDTNGAITITAIELGK